MACWFLCILEGSERSVDVGWKRSCGLHRVDQWSLVICVRLCLSLNISVSSECSFEHFVAFCWSCFSSRFSLLRSSSMFLALSIMFSIILSIVLASRPVKTRRPRKRRNCRSTTRRLLGDQRNIRNSYSSLTAAWPIADIAELRNWNAINFSTFHELGTTNIRNYTVIQYIDANMNQSRHVNHKPWDQRNPLTMLRISNGNLGRLSRSKEALGAQRAGWVKAWHMLALSWIKKKA